MDPRSKFPPDFESSDDGFYYRDRNDYRDRKSYQDRDAPPEYDARLYYQQAPPRNSNYHNAPQSSTHPGNIHPLTKPTAIPADDARLYNQPSPPRNLNPSYHNLNATQPSTHPNTHSLTKPVAIPATTPALGSAYLRAYPPALQGYGIDEAAFLNFLDTLNSVSVASPPLQIIGLAGNLLGPFTAGASHIAAGAVAGAASLGTYAVSMSRTEMHMRAANRDLFGPRGLKAMITNLAALARISNIPILRPDGKIDKHIPLLRPVLSADPDDPDAAFYDYASASPTISAQQRRIEALQPYIADLRIFSPNAIGTANPSSLGGIGDFYNSMSAKASERQRNKAENKLLKGRQKVADKMEDEENKLQREWDREMRKLTRDLEREIRRHGPGGRKAREAELKLRKKEMDFQEKLDKMERKVGKDDKEEEMLRKVHWLVIINI